MEENVFYANSVQAVVSEDEALLVFKIAWPDLKDSASAREICRIYIPKAVMNSIIEDWPIKIPEALDKAKEARQRLQEESVVKGSPEEARDVN